MKTPAIPHRIGFMLYVWLTGLLFANSVFWMLSFFALPGNWLIVVSTWAFALWKWDDGVFSIPTLVAITVLALIGEAIEFVGCMVGAKKAGAGKRGAIGALLGAICGAIAGTFMIPVPFIGTFIGACIGAGVGTWCMELTRQGIVPGRAVKMGVGASVGVMVGTGSKIILGLIICIIVAVAAFV